MYVCGQCVAAEVAAANALDHIAIGVEELPRHIVVGSPTDDDAVAVAAGQHIDAEGLRLPSLIGYRVGLYALGIECRR